MGSRGSAKKVRSGGHPERTGGQVIKHTTLRFQGSMVTVIDWATGSWLHGLYIRERS
jgi:hypothetical protein